MFFYGSVNISLVILKCFLHSLFGYTHCEDLNVSLRGKKKSEIPEQLFIIAPDAAHATVCGV